MYLYFTAPLCLKFIFWKVDRIKIYIHHKNYFLFQVVASKENLFSHYLQYRIQFHLLGDTSSNFRVLFKTPVEFRIK